MHLVLVGLSHHDAPIEVRERLSYAEHALQDALESIMAYSEVREAIILSTCNRTEIYAGIATHNADAAFTVLCSHLSSYHNLPVEFFSPFLYRKTDHEAASHIVRVASGLDSLVLGESHILGQVRMALRAAEAAGKAGGGLKALFQQALAGGKRVQTETTLREGSPSIGRAAVDLASRIFDDLSKATVLILGAGKMSELTARDLVQNGVHFVMVANRTYEKAVELADRLGGEAIHYDAFPQALAKADIVISATAAPHPILHKEMLKPIIRSRRGKPLFLIDIAVPRDIDADVAELSNTFLYNIDDLQNVAAEEAHGRVEKALMRAEAIAAEETEKFMLSYRSRAISPIIARLQAKLEEAVQKRLDILKLRLGPISERDHQLIAIQMRALMDEIALKPILRLKKEAKGLHEDGSESVEATQYDLFSAAIELFDLELASPEDTTGAVEIMLAEKFAINTLEEVAL